MTALTLTPDGTIPTARLALTRNGRKVGTVTMLAPNLWIAALDDPPLVVRGASLMDVREKLRGK